MPFSTPRDSFRDRLNYCGSHLEKHHNVPTGTRRAPPSVPSDAGPTATQDRRGLAGWFALMGALLTLTAVIFNPEAAGGLIASTGRATLNTSSRVLLGTVNTTAEWLVRGALPPRHR